MRLPRGASLACRPLSCGVAKLRDLFCPNSVIAPNAGMDQVVQLRDELEPQ